MLPAGILARLFALTGTAHPEPRAQVVKVLTRCPRERLVRAVAWYAFERGRGKYDAYYLVEGVRALTRSWTDYYEVDLVEPGTVPVRSITPESPDAAVMMRAARWGSGWKKPAVAYIGITRRTIDVAAAWLSASAGCILHDDCIEVPELGAICAAERVP